MMDMDSTTAIYSATLLPYDDETSCLRMPGFEVKGCLNGEEFVWIVGMEFDGRDVDYTQVSGDVNPWDGEEDTINLCFDIQDFIGNTEAYKQAYEAYMAG